jgi:hypothetical protein
MSFIDLPGIDEVTEPELVPEGQYDLVITDNPTPKKNEASGKMNMLVVLAIEGFPKAANVMHNLALPTAEDDEKAKQFKLLQIKRFCHTFGIEYAGGINTELFAGSKASNISLKKDEYQGNVRNIIASLPPLPSEG